MTNFQKTAEGVSGPVAIVAVGSQIARSDLSGLFQFAAIVNINLAVVNALPLPALDGGFLALLLAEAVRGMPLSQDCNVMHKQGVCSYSVVLPTPWSCVHPEMSTEPHCCSSNCVGIVCDMSQVEDCSSCIGCCSNSDSTVSTCYHERWACEL